MEKYKVIPVKEKIVLTSNGFGGFYSKETSVYDIRDLTLSPRVCSKIRSKRS